MIRTVFAERSGQWCLCRVKLDGARLSITGEAGTIVKPAMARKMARDYWEGFFDESPEEMVRMLREYGCRTPKGAARKVLDSDGEYHGLDVRRERIGNVYLIGSCGCIHDTIAEWFPTVSPYLKWHLNDMHADCEHQERMGWRICPGYHRPGETCPPPSVPLPLAGVYLCRERDAMGAPMCPKARPLKAVHAETVPCPTCDRAMACEAGPLPWGAIRDCLQVEVERPDSKLCIYNAIDAPCQECGYRYGSAWLTRALPPEVVAWAETVGEPA